MSEREDRRGSLAQRKLPTVRPELTMFPLDNELVAFSEEAQCLLALSPAAAWLVNKLRDGAAFPDLAKSLSQQGHVAPDEAEHYLAATLDALAAHGILGDAPLPASIPTDTQDGDYDIERQAAACLPYAPFDPAAEHRYSLLGTCALIRFGHLAQVRLVNSVIGHLASDERTTPDIIIDIAAKMLDNGHLRSDVYRDGSPIGQVPRLSQVAPIVKATLWQSAVNAYDFLFYIHAGVVATDAGCILLPGAPGSGKSSLTAALVHRGYRYFSDEVALIEPTNFRVPPVPLAISVKSTGWDLMAGYYPELLSLPVHVRRDSKLLRYIPPPAEHGDGRSMPVSHVIFPRYEAGTQTRMTPLPRAQALSRIMAECQALRLRLDQRSVGEVIRWIAGIECHDLTFSSLDAATDLVAEATTG